MKSRTEGMCRSHLQDRRIRQGSTCGGFMGPTFKPGLAFNPEDGGNIFLRNTGKFLSEYTASHPRSHTTRERQHRLVHYGILHNIVR
jgi:hypothetical protein